MKYNCPYHQDNALKPSVHNKDALICSKCKEDKVSGRDGIFDEADLKRINKFKEIDASIEIKFTTKKNHNSQALTPEQINNIVKDLTEEDESTVKNIYDDSAYDDYDGF